VLLAEETYALEHLPRASARSFEPHFQTRVLALEFLDSLGARPRCARRALESFHSGFGLQRPPAERGQLIAKMMNQFFEVRECGLRFRQFAV
jgi:hypothetical protein